MFLIDVGAEVVVDPPILYSSTSGLVLSPTDIGWVKDSVCGTSDVV